MAAGVHRLWDTLITVQRRKHDHHPEPDPSDAERAGLLNAMPEVAADSALWVFDVALAVLTQ